MLKIINFVSSYCLFVTGNDCSSKASSGSSGRCLPVPPCPLQAAAEPRWGLPRARCVGPGRAAHVPAAPRPRSRGGTRLRWRWQMGHVVPRHRGGAKASRWCPSRAWRQVAAGGARLLLSPRGAGARPRATTLRCRKVLLAFSDPDSATAAQSLHLDEYIECCRTSPGCNQQRATQTQHPAPSTPLCTAAEGPARAVGTVSSRVLSPDYKVQHPAWTAMYHTNASHKLLLFTETS